MKATQRRLSLAHFAFYRAYLEGPEASNIAFLADRYLHCGRDPRRVRAILRWLQDELGAAARRIEDRDAIRLLRLPKRLGDPEDIASNTPSLEAYREQHDPDGVFNETELLLQYREAYPQTRLSRQERRGLRLRERRLDALRRLEQVIAEAPASHHPVEAWLDPAIAKRLHVVKIDTLERLVSTINGLGYRWFARIPGLGIESAERVVTWLRANATTLQPNVAERALTPLRSQTKKALLASQIPTSPVRCLENMQLPQGLSGEDGSNRAALTCNRTGAGNDLEAVQAWLATHPIESATWRSYRAQAERILAWSVFKCGKALSSLSVADITAYRAFMENPSPDWVAPRGVERWSPHWRPFAGPLAPSSRATAHRILHAFFSWLVDMRYLDANPWVGYQRHAFEREASTVKVHHALTRAQYQQVMDFADRCADTHWGQRARFMFIFAYGTGLRVSEMAAATLGALGAQWVDEAIGTAWTLTIKGKHSKSRIVPLPTPVMDALHRYLRERGLPEAPTQWEPATPVIAGLTTRRCHRPTGLTADALADAFKGLFQSAAGHLASADPDSARCINQASTHWMRHTSCTHMLAKGVPLHMVQETMGHASPATTSRYLATDLALRIRAAEGFMSET
jgi:site-specific recombinase XerD